MASKPKADRRELFGDCLIETPEQTPKGLRRAASTPWGVSSWKGEDVINVIEYQLEPELTATEFIDVLQRSTLAERRPVDDVRRIDAMLRNADIIATARASGKLVGVSRAITDFAYCTYLSDLAVDESFQQQGIGRELIARTHAAAGLATRLVLLAAPKARSYYPHIGLVPHDSCWMVEPQPD